VVVLGEDFLDRGGGDGVAEPLAHQLRVVAGGDAFTGCFGNVDAALLKDQQDVICPALGAASSRISSERGDV
jgi:hypothetical protein